jgi:resuscitation-promoting factor RpfB
VQVSEVTETSAMPNERVETPDPNAFEGEKTVTQAGVPGEQATTYRVTVVDGVQTAKDAMNTAVTRAPVTEQVAVGTKPRPTLTPSADGLDWAALAKCESGGNPRAVNSRGGYYGLYQFSLRTWASVGGSGNPIDASPDEQTARAQLLYDKAGAGQWPRCGRHL